MPDEMGYILTIYINSNTNVDVNVFDSTAKIESELWYRYKIYFK